jgi:hypothetical protein
MFIAVLVSAFVGQTAAKDFTVFKPSDEAIIYCHSKQADEPSSAIVTNSETAMWDFEKVFDAKDKEGLVALEKQGRLAFIPAGTRVRIIKYHEGHKVQFMGTYVRPCFEVRLLEGSHKDQAGFVIVTDVRPRPVIHVAVDGPKDSPETLAKAILKQDKEAFKALTTAYQDAEAAAKKLPPGNRLRQARFDTTWRKGLAQVVTKYSLDAATAQKILDWGKACSWPVK